MDLTPALVDALVAFAKGTDPPLKAETETTDDFQTRSIHWIKGEIRSLRAFLWVLVLDAAARWLQIGGY